MLNALDYLTNDDDLLQLRGKSAQSHPFSGIEKMRRLNSLEFTKQEDAIFAEMNKSKQAMQEVWNKKDFEERENFTADELAAVAKVREQLNELRQQLSDIREQAFADIRRIDNTVSLLNLLAVPVLLVLLLLGLKFRQALKQKRLEHRLGFKIDKKLVRLAGGCLLIFAMALLSVYLSNRSSVDAYEGKPAFPAVSKNLNNIDSLSLKSNSAELHFIKKDGLWVLEEHENMPVYQERIRRLLTTLADAKFFERKTNKAENLGLFNLAPLADSSSKMIEVELKNGGELIQRFDLGDINIDLGRGSKAAYVKFDNQFQVWEISADFVDMNLDYREWTYGNLWDLRYGRLYSPSNYEPEQEKLLYLMKYALNTEIEPVEITLSTKPLQIRKLFIENDNRAVLSLYRENGENYAMLDFAAENTNPHLKLVAKYYNHKPLKIDSQKMEKILEQL